MLAAALGRFLQVATLTAKLGWSEERGTVFSLNVALNLALVPSDAPVCPHTSPGSRLWTVGPPIPLSFLPLPPPPPILTLIPQPGAKTQNLNIGHTPSTPQSTCAQFGCHQYCPPRTGQASFTQYWVSLLGTPPPQSPSLCLWTCFLLLHLTHFSVVSLSCHPCRGWAEGPPELVPLTIPHALPGSLAWPSESPCLVSTPLPLCPLPLCLASCHLSVPKPFQSFQVTILGEKDCAAFSL